MKKTNIFIILFVTTLISLIILFTFMINNYPSSVSPDWMSEMWSHMGGGMVENPNDPYLGYFGVLFTVLIAIVIISVAGLIYFLLFPELKRDQTKSHTNQQESSKKPVALEAVRKTLNTDEQKILEVLESHKGKYLQKYLGKEAGISRMKTHRILVRFAERGIVTIEKKANTNEIKLEEWLT